MKTTMLALIAFVIFGNLVGAQHQAGGSFKVLSEFPGSSLKWIRIAQPEFDREKLDVNKYFVTVVEEAESVTVILTGSRITAEVRGNPGPVPGYEVEIAKKDLKVVRANYIR